MQRKRSVGADAPVKASLELALLGLIAATPRISGYDIVRIFNLSMRHFWHAHQGQIYPTLERMERGGWIRSRNVIQRRRPNKRLFRIMPAGRRMLREWLERPFEDMKLKYPPLLRTRFLGHLGAEQARTGIQEQKGAWTRYLQELREIERTYFAGGRYPDVNAMFSCFTLRFGIAWKEASIAWCDRVISEIERNGAMFVPAARAASMARASRGHARSRGA